MKNYHFISLIFTILVIISSCKKEDPIPGPQGPAGRSMEEKATAYSKEGFVKGKVYSTDRNGADTLLGDFNYQYIFGSKRTAIYKGWGESYPHFNIVREDSAEYGNFFYLICYADPILEGFNSENTYINFGYIKDLGNGKYLKFGEGYRPDSHFREALSPSSQSTFESSNYSFDKTTGRMKFDFVINYDGSELLSGKNSKVIGSVDVTFKEIVY